MIGTLIAPICFAALAIIIFKPVALYFLDRKNLRKFPTLHPLSGLSDIPFMVESMKGFRSARLAELHHGKGWPVIRIGPNSLSFGTVDSIKAIYGHNSPTTKDKQYVNASGTHFHLADVVDKKEHARKRKVLASAFAAKNLEDWEYKVGEKVSRLIDQFDKYVEESAEGPLNYRSWTNLYTIDCLVDICLSTQLHCIERGEDTVTAEDLAGITEDVSFRDCLYATFHLVGDLVWSYDWFSTIITVANTISPVYSRLIKLGTGWRNLVHHLTNKRWSRYAAGERINDIFSSLMDDTAGNAHNLEWGEVVAEISLAVSGSSSTSNTIASTMQLLIENPQKLEKLQEELDSVMEPEEIIASYDKVKYLPYLRAVIDETLRLYPPISHGLPRETPKNGLQILDNWIAGNTTVSVSAYVAHRDPNAFPEPEKFMPERWLGDEGKQLQPNFIAFSAGARGCIVLLASLAHRYDFFKFSSDWKPRRRETMNLILGSLPIRIQKRSL
ncbi:predicted protein [Uncinocarpus reesii 1704]|uniref:Benzoate 4-monooxygenase cytochrome P450 n=1 Tax=Uncinocarpus reesii (strain UAMH 1704) TaxID=336963 RepID=C4JD78_UNCRE|nr:uncharacterized protein UREG_00268 [Uncinocarpus reesii 1704]EEP75422.1 predicted protein [Uncinocarpus reesii 1704]